MDHQIKLDEPAASASSGREGANVPVHTDTGIPGYSSTTNISSDAGEFQTVYRRPPPVK